MPKLLRPLFCCLLFLSLVSESRNVWASSCRISSVPDFLQSIIPSARQLGQQHAPLLRVRRLPSLWLAGLHVEVNLALLYGWQCVVRFGHQLCRASGFLLLLLHLPNLSASPTSAMPMRCSARFSPQSNLSIFSRRSNFSRIPADAIGDRLVSHPRYRPRARATFNLCGEATCPLQNDKVGVRHGLGRPLLEHLRRWQFLGRWWSRRAPLRWSPTSTPPRVLTSSWR